LRFDFAIFRVFCLRIFAGFVFGFALYAKTMSAIVSSAFGTFSGGRVIE
jgi:hypothetical protein